VIHGRIPVSDTRLCLIIIFNCLNLICHRFHFLDVANKDTAIFRVSRLKGGLLLRFFGIQISQQIVPVTRLPLEFLFF
jgi:hypothetical protein